MTTDLGSDPTLVSTSTLLICRDVVIESLRRTRISHVHGAVTKSMHILFIISSKLSTDIYSVQCFIRTSRNGRKPGWCCSLCVRSVTTASPIQGCQRRADQRWTMDSTIAVPLVVQYIMNSNSKFDARRYFGDHSIH